MAQRKRRDSEGDTQAQVLPGSADTGLDGDTLGVSPFSADDANALGVSAATGTSAEGGQFSGDELKFESFMFDPGQASTGLPAGPAQISDSSLSGVPKSAPASIGEPMIPIPAVEAEPTPADSSQSAQAAAIASQPSPIPSQEQSPTAAPMVEAEAAAPSGRIRTMDTRTPTNPLAPDAMATSTGPFPGTGGWLASGQPMDWSDDALTRVDDFSQVLIELYGYQSPTSYDSAGGPTSVAVAEPPVQVTPAAIEAAPPVPAEAVESQPQIIEQEAAAAPQITPLPVEPGPEAPATFAAAGTAGYEPAIEMPPWLTESEPDAASVTEQASQPEAISGPVEQPTMMEAPVMEEAPPQPSAQPEPVMNAADATSVTSISDNNPISGILRQTENGVPAATAEGMVSDNDIIEFESFMFDQGTYPPLPTAPNIEQLMPAVESMESAFVSVPPSHVTSTGPVPAEAIEEGAVPFWPRDAAQIETTPGEGYIEASQAVSQVQSDQSIAPAIEEAPEYMGSGNDSFAELPPIEPCDFSALNLSPEEESFGFDPAELTGLSPSTHESLMITTNLEALADILGGVPTSGVLDVASVSDDTAKRPMDAVASGAPETGVEGQASAEDIVSNALAASDQGHAPTWTSTVTSNLPTSTEGELTDMLPADGSQQTGSTDALSSGSLGIAPFDFTEIDFHAEDKDTGYLGMGATGGLGTVTEQLESPEAQDAPWAAPQHIEGEGRQEAEAGQGWDTYLFGGAQAEENSSDSPTGWMNDDSLQTSQALHEDEPAMPAMPAPPIMDKPLKARVAHSGRTGRVAAQASAGTAAPAQETEQAEAENIFPDKLGSGPLPALESYGELQELAQDNPDDISTHMALATAYTQSGEIDAALRVYRRILKKQSVTPAILQMIADELGDLEPEMSGHPRYHQVLGDLLMKQGLYQDAIKEYNKIS